jgi:DNA polymerase III epsilon subunit-like protein
METIDSVSEAKRKDPDVDEQTNVTECVSSASDEADFEVPKEHIRQARKKLRQSRPEASIQKSQSKTTISEVRNVLLWVLSDSQGFMPKWCMIRNKNLVESITVVIAPFIDRHTLFEHAGISAGMSQDLPFFSHSIRGSMIPMTSVAFHRYPTVCPVLATFLSSPILGKNPQWVEKLSDNEDEAPTQAETSRASISEFLMTEENRRVNDFPETLPGGRVPPGFVTTAGKKTRLIPEWKTDDEVPVMLLNKKDLDTLERDGDYCNLFGMDCEMVDTVVGKELARVSLIDHLGRVLYDSVVIPENEITDYITQYSGITAKMIRECKTSFKEAQKHILSYLDEKSILVGHAIQNDLVSLKLMHERVIDTSDIYPHPNGHPSKHSLVFLLSRVLRESLDREGGHDSVDDARAALRIAMKKLARGWEYNPVGTGTSRWAPLGTMIEGKAVIYDDLIDSNKYKLEGMDVNPEEIGEAKLRIHVIRDYQIACENNTPRREALVSTDAAIRRIVAELGDNHLLVLFSGCGDLHSFKRFEKLADICDDETQRVEVTKALQRAKDKAVSSFAVISAVGDIPEPLRSFHQNN